MPLHTRDVCGLVPDRLDDAVLGRVGLDDEVPRGG